MSLAIVFSRALNGVDSPEVTVEVHLANGLPAFTLVGLPDTEVKESKERVRAAILHSGFEFPARRITVNLAPADLPKESGRFDLPIAIALLAASGQIPLAQLSHYEFAGELALDGRLRPVRGVLPMICQAKKAKRQFILPHASANEAVMMSDAPARVAETLGQVCAFLNAQQTLPSVYEVATVLPVKTIYPDLLDVKGQSGPKLALEIAASGGHSLLLQGPPGTGKSMLAHRLIGLLPDLDEDAALEVATLYSLSLKGFDPQTWRKRMFRAPHHSASAVALVGGGSDPKPGEISLAHKGVLFLDELPEFDRRVLEMLREPLETGHVQISRANRQLNYPARFQMIAAMNPCPCGYLGHPSKACRCSPDQVSRYRNKLSGPFLDRIDLLVEVPALKADDLQRHDQLAESSEMVKERVQVCQLRQIQRQGKLNAALSTQDIDQFCVPAPDAKDLLTSAIDRLNLSARAYHRVLKVARTLADKENEVNILKNHILLALQLRRGLGNEAV